MCDSLSEHDSRLKVKGWKRAWYCCRDNTPNSGRVCRVCKQKRDDKETPMVIPRLRKEKK